MSGASRFHIDSQWREVAACVDEYERRSQDALPDLREVVRAVSPTNVHAALLELIKTDLEHRWRRQQQKSVQDYLAEFPELESEPSSLAELLKAENEARQVARDVTIGSSEIRRMVGDALHDTDTPVQESTIDSDRLGRDTVGDFAAPTSINGYTLVNELGRGGFGAVYLGYDVETDQQVAIKIAHSSRIDSSVGEMSCHEARGVTRVVHPNIVPLLDSGVLDDGRPYLIYHYVPGRTLTERLRKGDVPRDQGVEWVAAIADALHHAHKAGLVHRDVKPSNVLIDDEGKPWLTDFGLAKIDDAYVTDDSGVVLGTLSYMSPEQARGRSHWATPQSDVYSLSAVLYEALCGRPPFKAKKSGELLEQIRERHPIAPRSIDDAIDPQLEAICLRGLSKNPADRFQTAADLAQALREHLHPAPPERPRRAAWLPAAAVGLFAAGGMLAGYAVMQGRNDPAPTPPAASAAPYEAPQISLYVHHRAQNAGDGGWDMLTHDQTPIRSGDDVQFLADASSPTYLYAFISTRDGGLELVSPSGGPGHEPALARKLRYPTHEQQWVATPQRDGVVLFVVGAAREPLSKDQLSAVLEKPFDLPSPSAARLLLRTADPPVDQADRPLMTRGAERGSDGIRIETRETYALPGALTTLLEETFDAHHVVLLSHLQAADGG